MNALFEQYVHAVLESYFRTTVTTQVGLGRLLMISQHGIMQFADYYWNDGSDMWIGDAKYKYLTKGRCHPLKFHEVEPDKNESTDDDRLQAGDILSAGDVRQLTVYAELAKAPKSSLVPPNIALFYPFVGLQNECVADVVTTWNGSEFWLVPVWVKPLEHLEDAIRLQRAELTALRVTAATRDVPMT